MNTILTAILLAFSCAAFAQDAHKHSDKPKAASAQETSFGRAGDPKKASRTIDVDMSDQLRFKPADIEVKQGETIRFRVRNSGQTLREMVIGTTENLRKHAEAMRKHPGMKHDAPYIAHVAPGKTGSIVWQFTKAGEFQYACLVPGHFEAGMVGRIRVGEKRAALSDEEIEQYRAGAGMGYAKAAELNHFPGPMHVIELAKQLGLSAEQRAAAELLMKEHKAEARAIGAQLVESEVEVEALFRAGQVDESALARAVRTAAALRGEYRLAHLETHRRMRGLLTAEQVARYDSLRGHAPR
jgi:uncharacterized cupredoxin-like copper-binding protein/Spy/CpxP family protein refolding chaperone